MTEARPQRLASSASIAAWGVATWGAAHVAALMLESNPTAAAAVQAVLAEWGAGRLGVHWNDPQGKAQSTGAIARRAGVGILAGLVGAAIVLVACLATRLATLAPNTPSVASLGIGLLVAGLIAARDELLLHGVVLRVVDGSSVSAKLLACGLASAAAALGAEGTSAPEALAAGLGGAALGALWVIDRGAWMAWGARMAWLLATGSLVRGGLLDVRAVATAWGGGDAGFSGGWCAVAVLGVVASVALYAAKRRVLGSRRHA